MSTIVIADDQEMVRAGFRMILELAGHEVVAEAADGVEAVQATLAHRPDVVLMDIRMPRRDGIEATKRIVAEGVPSNVLILTTFDLDELVYGALHAGASGFLLKDAGRERLLEAIDVVTRGESLFSPEILARLVTHYVATPPASVERPPGLPELSAREAEILLLVAEGLSNAEIGERLFISTATVKTHVRHILQKLGLRDRVQAVVAAYESGLVQPGGD
jgi:DNA-binding NarL/FixJ family response regulator